MKSRPNPFLRCTAAVAIAFTASAQADDLTWDAAVNSNWNTTDANWTSDTWDNTVPDNAFFNTNTGTITLTEAITAGNLTFGVTNADLAGAFAGSALTVNGNLTVRANEVNGPGFLALSLSNNVNVLGDVAINRSVMQITGGTFTANRIGSTSAWGRLLVSGGSVTATNGVDDSILGSGVAMSVFLEGGTLSTPYLKTTSATWTTLGNDGVVLNGGTLRATDNSGDFIQVWDPSTWGIRNNVGVGPNGANIDTNGFDITINRSLENYGGAGTLTKDGLGKLTLVWSGHSGGTTVNAGTLEYAPGGGYSLLRNTLTVNAGGTVSVLGDGTGLGWQGGSMVTTLNINGGTVTSPGTMHVWNIGGGVNMTGGTLQSNGGVSDANGPQLEWSASTVNTNASADSATIGGRIRMRPDFGVGIIFNVADGAAASDLLVSAAITEASGGQGITKNGAGTMTITGVSTYTGGTVVNGGVLEVGSVAGATSNIGSQWLALDNTSTLRYTGTGSETSTRDIWINNAAGTRTFEVANVAGILTLSGGGGQINRDIRKAGAGTLVLDKVVSDAASVTADGGNLTLTAANTYSGITTINAGTLEVGGSAGSLGSGNVVNDAALVFNRSTDHSVGNAISGIGSVTQSGAGITTLSGTSTYTGATSVTAGGLNLTGSLTSNVTVSGGTLLTGEGSTTGSLTFTGASTLGFDPTSGTFLSAGSVDATGGTVTLLPSISASGTGIVVLEALGGITGGGNFVFSGRGSSYLNGGNTQLLFDFTPGTVVWKGTDGTNPTFWDVNTTTNWTLSGNPDKFFTGDGVTFDDTATGYDVAVQGASVTAGNITFDNTTTYNFSGGAIAGTGSLTKSGTGTVILKNANTFTGATVINAGTLQLGDGTGGNDGSLATSGITNDGTLAYNLDGNQTAGYAISGSGALTKTGAGTLTLTAANSYSGGTSVNGGILQAGNASAFGDSGSTITVNSGGALDINGQNLQAYTNAIVLNGAGIDANTGALFNSVGGFQLNAIRSISLGSDTAIGGNGGRFDLGRDHTGTVNQGNGHVLTKVGSNTVSILNTSTGFSGVVINGGVLTAETDASLATAPITINGGALGSWGGRTLSNTVTLAGAGGVDVQGGNLTLSGVVDGAGSLSKTGVDILTLTGNNTQTGTLYVSGGHVQFASTVGNATQGNVEMLNPGSFLLMAAPNQFGPNSGLLFNSSGGHNEFALYGNNQTIASLASTNGFAVVQNSHGGFGAASASSTLTVNQSTDTTYYGVFRDSTGSDAFTLGLVKEGAGKLTMATNTSHTGGTTVNGGVLEIAGSSGGNGYLRGTATVNAGGELRYTGGDGTGFGYNGGNKIDTLNINGGLVDSTNTAHLYGVNVNMTGGELRVSAGTIMWNYVTVNTAASASTALINGSITLRADNGFSTSTFNVADGAAATDLQVSGPISELFGAVGLTKDGAGTLELSGTNTYTGATTVSAGTLFVTGALGDSAVNVNGGAFGGTGTVGGSLTIASGFFHVSDLFDPLAVTGTITLFSGFGVDDLTGLDWGSVADGTYTLISGTLGTGVFDALANNSLGTAFDLGGGRSAYFQEGSLQLVVIPEPGAALLGGLGMLALLRRRR